MTYQYAVDAFDIAGNHSDPSTVLTVTTPPLGSTFSVSAEADAYVNAVKPSTKYGTATSLKVDGSPDVRSYLRFTVRGISDSVEVKRATLRTYANSTSALGHEAHGVIDNSWDERVITYTNAPVIGAALGSSGAFSTVGSVDVDVTPFITGNGTFSLALTTAGSTAISYRSRESGHLPELVIETGPPAPPPSTGTLFEDDFESGDLAGWDTVRGLALAQDVVNDGAWSARATSTDGVQAYASTSWTASRTRRRIRCGSTCSRAATTPST